MKKLLIYLLIFIFLLALALAITFNIASAPTTKNLLGKVEGVAEKIIPLTVSETTSTPPIINTTTTLMFGGDVMLSRVVNQKSIKYKDWAWPFAKVSSTLAAADLTIVNLESPFTIGNNHLVKTGSFSFNADPQSIAGLTTAGIDVVSLANNHTINQGQKGIKDTQKLLTSSSIAFTGAGLNEAQARTPVIEDINGAKIGFLAYAYPDDYSIAGTSTAGLANMDLVKLKNDISKLKTQADLVVIMMHAGIEYTNQPNAQQKQFAHTAIEAGADLVIGHHPHWVQVTEIYQGKPILYSLGNLVFDQMWSKETAEGALAEVTVVDKIITGVKIIPIEIKDYGQATVATGTIKMNILKRMQLTSENIKL